MTPGAGFVLAGMIGLAAQVAILAIVEGAALPILAGGLIVGALACSDWVGSYRTIRHGIEVAGLGGLAMLAGPGLDLVRSKPLGSHAAGSFLLMVVVCWWICDGDEKGESKIWAFCHRASALGGMLLGMAAVHLALGHHAMHVRGIATVHLAMVGAMAVGSVVAVTAVARVRRFLVRTAKEAGAGVLRGLGSAGRPAPDLE